MFGKTKNEKSNKFASTVLPMSFEKLPTDYQSWSRQERLKWCGDLLDSLFEESED
jgi:hypothetical protein